MWLSAPAAVSDTGTQTVLALGIKLLIISLKMTVFFHSLCVCSFAKCKKKTVHLVSAVRLGAFRTRFQEMAAAVCFYVCATTVKTPYQLIFIL